MEDFEVACRDPCPKKSTEVSPNLRDLVGSGTIIALIKYRFIL